MCISTEEGVMWGGLRLPLVPHPQQLSPQIHSHTLSGMNHPDWTELGWYGQHVDLYWVGLSRFGTV